MSSRFALNAATAMKYRMQGGIYGHVKQVVTLLVKDFEHSVYQTQMEHRKNQLSMVLQ